MTDGSLATLFRRTNNSLPRQQTGNEPQQQQPTQTTQAPENSSEALGHNSAESIDILDAKLRGVAQLVGDDHFTVELPDVNEKMGVLATVAGTSIPQQVQQVGGPKLRLGAGKLLAKLRAKVTSKLRDLPGLIAQKLRGKSSPFGQVILEGQPADEPKPASQFVNPTAQRLPIIVPASPTMQLPTPPNLPGTHTQQQQEPIAQQTYAQQQQVIDNDGDDDEVDGSKRRAL